MPRSVHHPEIILVSMVTQITYYRSYKTVSKDVNGYQISPFSQSEFAFLEVNYQ